MFFIQNCTGTYSYCLYAFEREDWENSRSILLNSTLDLHTSFSFQLICIFIIITYKIYQYHLNFFCLWIYLKLQFSSTFGVKKIIGNYFLNITYGTSNISSQESTLISWIINYSVLLDMTTSRNKHKKIQFWLKCYNNLFNIFDN